MFVYVCLYVCMYIVHTNQYRSAGVNWSSLDGQNKSDLFWKGKHRPILHGLCPYKADNPPWILQLSFKGLSLLCSDILCLSQNYIFFKVITWEKNSCQIYIYIKLPNISCFFPTDQVNLKKNWIKILDGIQCSSLQILRVLDILPSIQIKRYWNCKTLIRSLRYCLPHPHMAGLSFIGASFTKLPTSSFAKCSQNCLLVDSS